MSFGFGKEEQLKAEARKEFVFKKGNREIYGEAGMREKRREAFKSKFIKQQFKEQPKHKRFASGFLESIKNIGRSIPQQRQQSQLSPREKQLLMQIRQQQMQRVQEEQPQFNPFEHRDPMEVWGDDSLTFFDMDRAAPSNRTGRLFGI